MSIWGAHWIINHSALVLHYSCATLMRFIYRTELKTGDKSSFLTGSYSKGLGRIVMNTACCSRLTLGTARRIVGPRPDFSLRRLSKIAELALNRWCFQMVMNVLSCKCYYCVKVKVIPDPCPHPVTLSLKNKREKKKRKCSWEIRWLQGLFSISLCFCSSVILVTQWT